MLVCRIKIFEEKNEGNNGEPKFFEFLRNALNVASIASKRNPDWNWDYVFQCSNRILEILACYGFIRPTSANVSNLARMLLLAPQTEYLSSVCNLLTQQGCFTKTVSTTNGETTLQYQIINLHNQLVDNDDSINPWVDHRTRYMIVKNYFSAPKTEKN